MGNRVKIVLFCSVLSFTGALAVTPQLNDTQHSQRPSTSARPITPSTQVLAQQSAEDNVTSQPQVWNLKDADIRAVIQTVSLLTGKNFIIDPRVQGKVTFVSHHPMSIDELYSAFLSMLQVLNYTAVPSGHVVKIVPSLDAATGGVLATPARPGIGDELVVRVIPINNVSATQLVPALRPLMPQWSSVTAYAPSNSLILVGTASNVNRLARIVHNMDSRNANEMSLVTLQHANAKKIVSVIDALQTSDRANGKVSNVSLSADEESNSILISGNYANSYRMRVLIMQMDKQSANDGGDTEVIYLNYLTAKKLAPVLTKIAKGTLTTESKGKEVSVNTAEDSASISIQPEESDNAIVMNGPRALIQDLKKVVLKLDSRPQQVLVEAIIVRVNESLLNQLGIVWGTVNSSGADNVSQTATTTSSSNTLALKVGPKSFGVIGDGDIEALMHALVSNGSTDILSTPSIVVMNNQAATIADGQNIGVLNREYSTNASDPTTNEGIPFNTYDRKDITLSLKVTPQISPNNMLRMKIDQKDDTLDAVATSDPDNPVIDTSKIQTNVLVHSGDILVLGGLADHQQKQTKSKVPILGDIPLLGALFRYNNHDVEKKDLMVFLKPVILGSRHTIRSQTLKRYDYIRAQQIKAQAGIKLDPSDMPVLPNISGHHVVLPAPGLPAPTETQR